MSEATNRALMDLADRGVEVDFSGRRRWEYSYDASNYRVRPAAVAFPRDVGEARALLAACRESGLPLTSRGGGTSMAGNAIGEGLVIDFSRHMRGVGPIEVGTDGEASVRVEAGVVLSELRAQVERASGGALTFAPDPSSHTRATLGGSHGNDACGNHSVAYGRTSGHVLEAEILTADGMHLIAGRGGLRAFDRDDRASAARADELNESLRSLAGANLAAFRTQLQRIPRQVSGYHLGHLLPEEGFDVAAALAGSEGTCAVLVGARVRLVPKPATTALLCVGYDDSPSAARDVMPMLSAKPTAIEGLDAAIVEIMRARRGADSVDALPQGRAYVIVEFSAESLGEARAACERLADELMGLGRARDFIIETDPGRRAKLWRVREDGAGLVSRRLDGTQTWPGWEDSAVAPERLADYLEELSALIADYGYTGPMYGHFGAGCVHVRIDFDLRSDAGRERFAAFIADASALVVRHGGSLSGEHGDGRARSQYLSLMYSPEVVSAFREFKRIWDPRGLLNPGIIVDPEAASESLALAGVPERAWKGGTPVAMPAGSVGLPILDPFVAEVQACIGVGRCRATSGGFMCPSYRATGDEKDSTRGRSRVLQEMVRTSRTPAEGWRSPEVMEALDLCLSCKACSTDCPAGVDIADVKSQFTQEFYRGRIRPFAHYTIGWLPRWIPILTRLSALVNAGARLRVLRAVAHRLGISAERALPEFRPHRELRRRRAEAGFDRSGDTVLFVDSFTGAFRPEVVPAAARVLQESGSRVACAPDACCGLTWISTGQRDAAARRMSRLVERLDDGTDRPIVVLEPSCAAAIRDDGPELAAGDPARKAAAERVARRVQSFATAVRERQSSGWRPSASAPAEVVVQTHCHEHAVFGSAVQRDVLRGWGVERVVESSSCCGVAGNFGFERDHYELSMRVAEHSIVPALAAGSADAPVLTDGFSCTMQVSQLEPGRGSRHLAQLLDPSGIRAARDDLGAE